MKRIVVKTPVRLLFVFCLALSVSCGDGNAPALDGGGDASGDVPDAQQPVDVDQRDPGPRDGEVPTDTTDPVDASQDLVPSDVDTDTTDPVDANPDLVPADVDTDTAAPDGVDMPSPAGRVAVIVSKWGSGDYGADAWGNIGFYDGPMRMDAFAAYTPGRYETVVRQGDCVMYMGALSACDPACDWDEYCDNWNVCQTAPSALSAGTVLVTFGAAAYEFEPTGDPATYYYFDSVPSALIHSGNMLIASAPGATGGFGPFELSATGIDPVKFAVDDLGGTLTLVDDQDNVVTWDVPKDPAGLVVELLVNVGWHGAPPEVVMYCEKAASAGRLTIPQAVVNGLPPIGGMGLFQHSSHIAMSRSVTAEVDGRTVEFRVTRRHGINPLHNQPEF